MKRRSFFQGVIGAGVSLFLPSSASSSKRLAAPVFRSQGIPQMVRDSNTTITVTFPPYAQYDPSFSISKEITSNIPATMLKGGSA